MGRKPGWADAATRPAPTALVVGTDVVSCRSSFDIKKFLLSGQVAPPGGIVAGSLGKEEPESLHKMRFLKVERFLHCHCWLLLTFLE